MTSSDEWFCFLGACPRIGRGRVPGLEGVDARRRDAGDVGAHRRGAPTKQMPLPSRNPKGAWGLHDDRCVARRRRCAWTSPPPRALRSPCKPHARDPFEFSDRLLVADICVFDCIMKAVTHQPYLLVGHPGKERETIEGRRSVRDSNGTPYSQTGRKFPLQRVRFRTARPPAGPKHFADFLNLMLRTGQF